MTQSFSNPLFVVVFATMTAMGLTGELAADEIGAAVAAPATLNLTDSPAIRSDLTDQDTSGSGAVSAQTSEQTSAILPSNEEEIEMMAESANSIDHADLDLDAPATTNAAVLAEPDVPAITDEPSAALDAEDEEEAADTAIASEESIDLEHALLDTDESEDEPVIPLANAVTVAKGEAKPLILLGETVLPGNYQRLSWTATELFEGVPVATPVLVVNGRLPGPTLCLTAAVHGDELNGIEMVRRVLHDIKPRKLSGAVIGVPIVNLQGFRRASRYLPDRRDLNRYFPGNSRGSAASRIAYSFFNEVVSHCDALVDLHTGSFERANLPQLRADLRDPDVVTLTQGFGSTVILHSDPSAGTLRYAATAAGIPAVTIEAGGPSVLELAEVKHGVKGIQTLLNSLGMLKKTRLWGNPEPVYYRSTWVRANRGGILLADVSLGGTVRKGALLGTITDPMNNESTEIFSEYSGRIIGMARNQVVMPGFAAFHIGIQADKSSDTVNEDTDPVSHDEAGSNQDYVDGMSE